MGKNAEDKEDKAKRNMAKPRAERAARRQALALPDDMAVEKINDVCAILGVGRSTLWRWIRDKKFPAPQKHIQGWTRKTLRQYIAQPAA